MPTRRSVLAALSGVGLAGCASSRNGGDAGGATDGPDRTGTVAPPPGASRYRSTHPQPTGNRALDGNGDVRGVEPVTIGVAGHPRWLVTHRHPTETGSGWTVVTADGSVTRWRVAAGTATREEDDGTPGRHGPDRPPVVAVDADGSRLVGLPDDIAPMAPPAVASGARGDAPVLLYVAGNGDLVVAGAERTRFPVDGLPDGRIVAAGDGRCALFGGATGRYAHGALGDTTEGSSLVIVDPTTPDVVARATVGPPAVFEGLRPLVADLDGDGAPEVMTTVADSAAGARVAVFDAAGDRLATGPVHGSGWRHQLAVAPFGPDGRPELAVVRRPHVERVLEFYRLRDGSLTVTATVDGLASHAYGSRVIDGAVAADFDGDGTVEALVPTTARDALAAARRTPDGATIAWRLPLGGRLTTNVTGVALRDGRVAVGAGTADGVRIWQG